MIRFSHSFYRKSVSTICALLVMVSSSVVSAQIEGDTVARILSPEGAMPVVINKVLYESPSMIVLQVGGHRFVSSFHFASLKRSTDSGRSWHYVGPRGVFGELTQGQPYYYLSNDSLYKSNDFGAAWRYVAYHPEFGPQEACDSSFSIQEGGRLCFAPSDRPLVFSSLDSGKTFNIVWSDPSYIKQYQGPLTNETRWFSHDSGLVLRYSGADRFRRIDGTTDGGQSWRILFDSTRALYQYLQYNRSLPVWFTVIPPGYVNIGLSITSGLNAMNIWSKMDYNSPVTNIAALNDSLWVSYPDRWGLKGGLSPFSPPLPTPCGRQVYYVFREGRLGIGLDYFSLREMTTDAAKSWVCLDTDDRTTCLNAELPNHGSTFYRTIGYQVYATHDKGSHWDSLMDLHGPGAGKRPTAMVAPTDRLFFGCGKVVIITDTAGKLLRSRDMFLEDDIKFISADSRDTFFVGDGKNIVYTLDGGVTITAPPGYPYQYGSNFTYDVRPATLNTIMMRVSSSFEEDFISHDGELTWDSLQYAHCVAIGDSMVIGITTSSRQIMISRDGGKQFDPMGQPPADANVVSKLYVFDSTKIIAAPYYTTDLGVTWSRIPGWRTDIELTPIGPMIALADTLDPYSRTYDLWRLDLPWYYNDTTKSVDTTHIDTTHSNVTDRRKDLAGALESARLSLDANSVFHIAVDGNGVYSYSISDILGRRKVAGKSVSEEVAIPLGAFPSGTYYVRLERGQSIVSRSIVVRR